MKRLLVIGVAVCLLPVVTGCNSAKTIPTIPVEGKVTVDGKNPAGPFMIILTPDAAGIPTINGSAKTDGTFTLTTNKPGDGAPEGSYKVGVGPDPMSPGTTPSVKPTTVQITKPASGPALVELKLESAPGGSAGGMMMSPLPKPGMEGGRPGGGGAPGPGMGTPGATP